MPSRNGAFDIAARAKICAILRIIDRLTFLWKHRFDARRFENFPFPTVRFDFNNRGSHIPEMDGGLIARRILRFEKWIGLSLNEAVLATRSVCDYFSCLVVGECLKFEEET